MGFPLPALEFIVKRNTVSLYHGCWSQRRILKPIAQLEAILKNQHYAPHCTLSCKLSAKKSGAHSF